MVRNFQSHLCVLWVIILAFGNAASAQTPYCYDNNVITYFYSLSTQLDEARPPFSVPQSLSSDQTQERLFGEPGFLERDNLWVHAVRQERYESVLMETACLADYLPARIRSFQREWLAHAPLAIRNSQLYDLLVQFLTQSDLSLDGPLSDISAGYQPDVGLVSQIISALDTIANLPDVPSESDVPNEVVEFFQGSPYHVYAGSASTWNGVRGWLASMAEAAKILNAIGAIQGLSDTGYDIAVTVVWSQLMANDAARERLQRMKAALQRVPEMWNDPALRDAVQGVEEFLNRAAADRGIQVLIDELIAHAAEIAGDTYTLANALGGPSVLQGIRALAIQAGHPLSYSSLAGWSIGLMALQWEFAVILDIQRQLENAELAVCAATVAKTLCQSTAETCELRVPAMYAYLASANYMIEAFDDIAFWNFSDTRELWQQAAILFEERLNFEYALDCVPPLPSLVVLESSGASNDDRLVFGEVPTCGQDSATFTISNVGTADLLVGSWVSSNPAFTLSPENPVGPAGDVTLAPGDDLTVTVSFAPGSETSYTGQIAITSNDLAHSPYYLEVTGSGIACGAGVTVRADPNPVTIPASTTVTAEVRDGYGSLVGAGEQVHFTPWCAGVWSPSADANTNAQGVATATYTPNEVGPCLIEAEHGATGNSGSTTLHVNGGDIVCFSTLERRAGDATYQDYYYNVTITYPSGDPVNQQPIVWTLSEGTILSSDELTGPDGYASMNFRITNLDQQTTTVTVNVVGSACSSSHPVRIGPIDSCPVGRTIGVGGTCMDIDPSGTKAAFGQGKSVKLLDLTTEESCSRDLLDIIYGDVNAVAFNGSGAQIGLGVGYRQRGIQPASCPLTAGGCFPETASSEGIGDGNAAEWIESYLLVAHECSSTKLNQLSLYDVNCALLDKENVTNHRLDGVSYLDVRPGSTEWAGAVDGPDSSGHDSVIFGSVSGTNIVVQNSFHSGMRNRGLSWSGNGLYLVVGSSDNQLVVYSRSNLTSPNPPPETTIALSHAIEYIAFSTDSAYMAVGSAGGTTVTVLDTSPVSPSSWTESCSLHFEQGCTGLEWLPNTHTLAHASMGQIQFAYLDDTLPPNVVISWPPDGYETAATPITVTGNVTDANGIEYVEILVNGDRRDLPLDEAGNFSEPVGLEPGPNTITVQALDNAGRPGGDSVAVTLLIDETPPVISDVTTSPSGVLRPGDSLTVCATITDAWSGVDDSTCTMAIQLPDENDLETISLARGAGDRFCGTWDTTGYPSGSYYIDLSACDLAPPAGPYCGEAENVATPELNLPPSVIVTQPSEDVSVNWGDTFPGAWTTTDDDSDALTSLYLDADCDPDAGRIPIEGALGLGEGPGDLDVDTTDFFPGTYVVLAIASDEFGSVHACSTGRVVIEPVCTAHEQCDDGNTCTNDICENDLCSNPLFADGTSCSDDGNECTDDVCMVGACMHPNKQVGSSCGDPTDTDCDNPDTCNGAGACLTNHEAGGTICTDDGNDCMDDVCDDAGACTHANLPDGTQCADDGNDCTEDVCAAGECMHPRLPSGWPCGSISETECDFEDSCNAAGVCLPNHALVGIPCGDPTGGDCTDPDNCDGFGSCRPNHKVDGTPCEDGQFCTVNEACTAGSCSSGEPKDCSDGVACTADDCDEINNVCTHPLTASNCLIDGVCYTDDEANPANECEVCNSALILDAWSPQPAGATCPGDGNECTNDVCDGAGACEHPDAPDGTACNADSNACTDDVCLAGDCAHPFSALDTPCGDPTDTDCDNPDSCDGSGNCDDNREPDGTPCEDGQSCTVNEACTAGSCGSGQPKDCSDGVTCTADDCDEINDVCTHALTASNCLIDGACYSDGEANPANECEVCDSATDPTAWSPQPAATTCPDDGNQCTDDVCDGAGTCTHPNLPDGTAACDDGNACTDDACNAGVCEHTNNAAACNDGNDCTSGDVCSNGVCTGTPIPNCPDPCEGIVCNDNDACTNDSCTEGVCANTPIDCEDSDPCTTNTCTDGTCEHLAIDCDDGQFCNGVEVCVDGECQPGDRPCPGACCEATDVCDECPCTTDAQCDDGDVCNGSETCQNGTCVDGTPRDCDDNHPCTDDTCNAIRGCIFTPDDTNSCDDGDPCTDDVCVFGNCEISAIECPDGEICSDGQCVPASWTLIVATSPAVGPNGGPLVGPDGRPLPTDGERHEDGAVVEIPVPATPEDAVGRPRFHLVFERWEGDVPPGHETDDPLVLVMDSDKQVTAVFQALDCLEDAHCDDERFCNGTEVCLDSECSLGQAPCSPNETCDEETDRCLALSSGSTTCGSMGSGCGPTGPAMIIIFLGLFSMRFVGPGRCRGSQKRTQRR